MKHMPPADDVLAFEAIARTGSMTAAAEVLGCTKSMVSLRLKALEKQLGAMLVLRTTRRLSLTEAGQQLLPHAEALRRSLEQMQAAVDGTQQEVSGPLAISTMVSTSQVLATVLGELGMAYPGLRLRLDIDNRVQDPVEDVLDFCLRARNVVDESLVARLVAVVEEGVYAAPSLLQKQGWPQHPAELESAGLISHAAGEPVSLYCGDDQHSWQAAAPVLECSAYLTCLTSTLQGMGMSILPNYMAAPYCRSGQLQRVLPAWRAERWPVYLVYSYRQPMPRKYTVFCEFMLPRLRAAFEDRAD